MSSSYGALERALRLGLQVEASPSAPNSKQLVLDMEALLKIADDPALPPPIGGGGAGAGEGGVEDVVNVDPLALEGGGHLGILIVIVNTTESETMGQAARAANNLTSFDIL